MDLFNIPVQSNVCFIDETFKLAPPLFTQVFVILCKKLDGVLSILLPNKMQATYERMFYMIRDLAPGFNPVKFSCDYEKAVIGAIKVKICFGEIKKFVDGKAK